MRMTESVVVIVAIGVVVGWLVNFLLRGRAKQSHTVVGAGVLGAAAGALFRQTAGPDDALIWLATILAGAFIVSFAFRIRMFAVES